MDSASRKGDSASPMKMIIELSELDEQLGESDEDRHKTRRVKEKLGESDEFFLDMHKCVSVELQGRNSTGDLKFDQESKELDGSSR